jgi:hypothetical protein
MGKRNEERKGRRERGDGCRAGEKDLGRLIRSVSDHPSPQLVDCRGTSSCVTWRFN